MLKISTKCVRKVQTIAVARDCHYQWLEKVEREIERLNSADDNAQRISFQMLKTVTFGAIKSSLRKIVAAWRSDDDSGVAVGIQSHTASTYPPRSSRNRELRHWERDRLTHDHFRCCEAVFPILRRLDQEIYKLERACDSPPIECAIRLLIAGHLDQIRFSLSRIDGHTRIALANHAQLLRPASARASQETFQKLKQDQS